VSLPLAALAAIREDRPIGAKLDVSLAQRRHSIAAILTDVFLRSGPKEALADQAQRDRAGRSARQLGVVRVRAKEASDARQRRRELPHAVVLAEVAFRDRALVVPVLFPPAAVESPGLNRVQAVGGDMDVAPAGWNAQLRDPSKRARVAHRRAIGIEVPESRLRASLALQPAFGHGAHAAQEPVRK
jgi:hypothetical protein